MEGGTAPTILNAANEVAVESFISGKIGFLDITSVVEETLTQIHVEKMRSLEHVFDIDSNSRRIAKEIAGRF